MLGVGECVAGTEVLVAPLTHEQFIHAIREIVVPRLNEEADRRKLVASKLVYGAGDGRAARGVCFFDAWQRDEGYALLEVCAFGEESEVQLAGTTIHELGHCLAGPDAGHSSEWKRACTSLGLIRCEAAGQAYAAYDFAPEVWERIARLPSPSDGVPTRRTGGNSSPRPCPLGTGTRGGISRGPGSGSRLRLYKCECQRPVKVRVASDDFRARCLRCESVFQRASASERPRVAAVSRHNSP